MLQIVLWQYYYVAQIGKRKKEISQWGNHFQNYGCSLQLEELNLFKNELRLILASNYSQHSMLDFTEGILVIG